MSTTCQVLVRSAALASCAIPGVFAPVELMAKVLPRTLLTVVAVHTLTTVSSWCAQAPDGSIRVYIPGGLRWTDGVHCVSSV